MRTVSFPDFSGAGADLDDARATAEEALALHIEGLVEDGEAIPEPSSLEVVMSDVENKDCVAILVAVKTEAKGAIRVNVTLPKGVLKQIDAFAEAHGQNECPCRKRATASWQAMNGSLREEKNGG
ncbi:type II toxin-antitoxin system HicB family antitoxin [Sinorhizobium meliloti]|uniref:type II toxin-antitoxin system HicB family antitoxin n=1 Tax=Rhizobium meliloti TaxID=382 RepID=UPI001F1BB5D3|nr:type II toxin-antitoxin system HicB family antitoxin [Sinorhizobium meliloti]